MKANSWEGLHYSGFRWKEAERTRERLKVKAGTYHKILGVRGKGKFRSQVKFLKLAEVFVCAERKG